MLKEAGAILGINGEKESPKPACDTGTSFQEERAPSSPKSDESELVAKLDFLRGSRVRGARILSSRSLSLRLRLQDDRWAVFKPMRNGDRRPLYEVAAFRMAELLGVERVPPSTMREVELATLVSKLKTRWPEECKRLEESVTLSKNGRVIGAVMAWVDDMDKEASSHLVDRNRIGKWLQPARREEGESSLAREASVMVTFDYLIGNWDRFSGGNYFVSSDHRRLVLLDHNGAFAPWSDIRRSRMEARLTQTERFSASLIRRLRALSREHVDSKLSSEPWHGSMALLTKREIREMLVRKERLIQHVDQLIGERGEAAVLAFP